MKEKKYNADLVATVIGSDSEFRGTLHAQGSVRIEGSFEGEVISQGEVYVGVKSKIKGNISAKRIVIAGEVNGDVEVVQGLKIMKTGKVYGNITGDRLIIEEGGIYKGKVNMDVISSKNLYEGKFELVK